VRAVELAFRARTYDVDACRHVHNAVYIRWLEDLRTAFLDAYYPFQRFVAEGIGPVLIKTCIEYRKPIRLDERVTGRMWVTGHSRVRFDLRAEFVRGDDICAYAEQQCAVINIESGRPVRVPQAFLDALKLTA
jgi:acyl-CoA thioester hydrolase